MDQTLSDMQASLRGTQQALLDMLDQADDKALYENHDQDNWSFAVMLSHLTEARGFFAGQAEQFIATPSGNVGRTLDEEHRVEAIQTAQKANTSRDELRRRLVDSYATVTRVLSGIKPDDLQLTCNHVRFGPMTLAEFLRRGTIDHDQAHVQQAQSFLQNGTSGQ